MPIKIENFKKIHFETIESTNEYAKSLAIKKDAENAIITSDIQTKGKTTKKNSIWVSPYGNLYITFMIKMLKEEEKFFPQFSFLTALSTVEAILDIANKPIDIKIKWPNDILLNTQKLAGILIEKEGDFAIIGIGVNVLSSPSSDLTVYPTTSLKESEIDTNKDKVAEKIFERLIENINICKKSKFEKIINQVKPFMYKIGEQIFISFNNSNITGKFEGLAPNGGLILKTESETKTLLSGELTKENFI